MVYQWMSQGYLGFIKSDGAKMCMPSSDCSKQTGPGGVPVGRGVKVKNTVEICSHKGQDKWSAVEMCPVGGRGFCKVLETERRHYEAAGDGQRKKDGCHGQGSAQSFNGSGSMVVQHKATWGKATKKVHPRFTVGRASKMGTEATNKRIATSRR